MNEYEFKKRTKSVALQIIKLSQALPKNREADVMARQLVRAGTSVGANYRAVCRAKSKPDMLNKLMIVEEEAGCYPDLDGSGALDLFDFLAFTNLFNAEDSGADCDGDGVFSLFDFLCFVNAFNAGC